jgi:hypothetical protein
MSDMNKSAIVMAILGIGSFLLVITVGAALEGMPW